MFPWDIVPARRCSRGTLFPPNDTRDRHYSRRTMPERDTIPTQRCPRRSLSPRDNVHFGYYPHRGYRPHCTMSPVDIIRPRCGALFGLHRILLHYASCGRHPNPAWLVAYIPPIGFSGSPLAIIFDNTIPNHNLKYHPAHDTIAMRVFKNFAIPAMAGRGQTAGGVSSLCGYLKL